MDIQAITWVQILQVGGLAGVISALIGVGSREFFEQRERKRKARYLALRLSLILEDYYHACKDRVYDIENYRGSRGNAGSNEVGLPELSSYPEESVAWIYLDQAIADEVLSFPAAIRAIDEGIHFNASFDNLPDGPDPEITLEPLFEMAFRTIDLARRVRSKHSLVGTTRTSGSEHRLKEMHSDFLKKLADEKRSQLLNPFS